MTNISKDLAGSLAKKIGEPLSWDHTRDRVDSMTSGELDCFKLDLLTDWVMSENKPNALKRTEAYSDGVADFQKGVPPKDASEYWGQHAQHYTQGYADAKSNRLPRGRELKG